MISFYINHSRGDNCYIFILIDTTSLELRIMRISRNSLIMCRLASLLNSAIVIQSEEK